MEIELIDFDLRAAVEVGAVADGDADVLEQTAHALKGSSANLGACGVAARCAELEALSRHGDQHRAAKVISRLETELERVRGTFHAELGKTVAEDP